MRRLRRWWNRKYWKGYYDGMRETNEVWVAVVNEQLSDPGIADCILSEANSEVGIVRF